MRIAQYQLIGLILSSLAISGCASIAPPEVRRTQFVETTTATKDQAYSRALAYISKTWKNANLAVQMRDAANGQIIIRSSTLCNVFRQAGDPNDYSLQYTLDLQLKDHRARFLFEDLTMLDQNFKPFPFSYGQITDDTQVVKSKVCLEPLKSRILKAVTAEGDSW